MDNIQPLHTKIEKTIQATRGFIVLESPTGFPSGESNLYGATHFTLEVDNVF